VTLTQIFEGRKGGAEDELTQPQGGSLVCVLNGKIGTQDVFLEAHPVLFSILPDLVKSALQEAPAEPPKREIPVRVMDTPAKSEEEPASRPNVDESEYHAWLSLFCSTTVARQRVAKIMVSRFLKDGIPFGEWHRVTEGISAQLTSHYKTMKQICEAGMGERRTVPSIGLQYRLILADTYPAELNLVLTGRQKNARYLSDLLSEFEEGEFTSEDIEKRVPQARMTRSLRGRARKYVGAHLIKRVGIVISTTSGQYELTTVGKVNSVHRFKFIKVGN
jgi:hypothetical protein